MLIDSMRISAFRGIQTSLGLDLNARLTLIHAANGTGKTSVCDATEWLITGQVQRLSTLSNHPTSGVRNLFAAERETEVEVKLRLGSTPFHIRRIGTGASEKLELENPSWRKFDQVKLLEHLAPSNLPAGSTRQQNLNRAAWFRAVRLLEATNLDILLDDTPGAQAVRGLLFSNLFGVGDLQAREQTLEKIRDAMMRPSRIEAEASRLRVEIQGIEAALNVAGERVSAPLFAAARQNFNAAGRYLAVAVDGESPIEQIRSMLESVLASKQLEISRSRDAHAKITREWDRFQALTAELLALEKEQATDSVALRELRRLHTDVLNAVRESATGVTRCLRREERLRTLIADPLLVEMNSALEGWNSLQADSAAVLDPTALATAEQAGNRQLKSLEQKRAVFSECSQNIPAWLALVEKIRITEKRNAEIVLAPTDQIAANDRNLSNAREELRRIEAESERVSAPLERLRSEGRRLLDSLAEEHRCPLCSHDHETPIRLREAIDAGLQALPLALSQLAAQKSTQEAIVAQAIEQHRRWAAMTSEVDQLNRSISDARKTLTDAKEKLRMAAIDLPEIDDPEFLQQFRDAAASLDREIEIARQNRSQHAALRVAGDSLAMARDKIVAAFSEEFADFQIASLPPAQWKNEIGRLKIALNELLQKALAETISTRSIGSSHQQKADTLSDQISGLAATIDSRATRLSKLRSDTLPLTQTWLSLVGESPLTKDALDTIPHRLTELSNHIDRASAEIRLGVENANKATEAVERERQAVANRGKLTELRGAEQRLKIIEMRRAELDNAVNLLRKTKESFINRQIQPLCKVITSLYLRAQSNAFITAIGTDEQGGAHRWTASAENSRLEAVAQLSQGQRQDFALAIFLARAREVRGTFFLDEPLLHLDDLNRVALLDVLRVLILEPHSQPLRLVITTSSNSLVRHFREKFSLLPSNEHGPALRVYSLTGNPRTGVRAVEEALPAL